MLGVERAYLLPFLTYTLIHNNYVVKTFLLCYSVSIMNSLKTVKRVQVVSALVEGNSLRSIVRMTGVALNTVTKLLVDMGCACAAYHHRHVRNVRVMFRAGSGQIKSGPTGLSVIQAQSAAAGCSRPYSGSGGSLT